VPSFEQILGAFPSILTGFVPAEVEPSLPLDPPDVLTALAWIHIGQQRAPFPAIRRFPTLSTNIEDVPFDRMRQISGFKGCGHSALHGGRHDLPPDNWTPSEPRNPCLATHNWKFLLLLKNAYD
jgi:hypothetical protein